jgi:hypothetical protein
MKLSPAAPGLHLGRRHEWPDWPGQPCGCTLTRAQASRQLALALRAQAVVRQHENEDIGLRRLHWSVWGDYRIP